MPIISPTPGDVHVNSTLTNMSIAYMQDASGFVADQVFTAIPSDKQSDIYWTWPRDVWNRDEMKERAPGAPTPGIGFNIARLPFYIPVFGIHHPIPDQVVSNVDDSVNYDAAATSLVTMKALIKREVSWVNTYFNYAAWGVGAQGAGARSAAFNPADPANNNLLYWSNAGSTPIEDLRSAMTYVQLRSGGFRPNTLTLSRPVADVLFDHPELIARVNAGQTPGGPAISNQDHLARILGLTRVLVMDGIINSAKQGLVEANAFFGGKSALLTFSQPTPNKMMPSAGYTFNWTGYLGATANGTRIKRFYVSKEASTYVEAETAFVQQITGQDCGYFFNNIIA